VARYHAQQNMAEVDRLKKASSAFLFYLTLGGSVLALLIIKPLTGFFHVPRAALTMAALGCIVAGMWGTLATSWCQGLSLFNLLAVLSLGSVALRILAGGIGCSVWPSAEMGMLASVAASAFTVTAVFWREREVIRTRADWQPIWQRDFLVYLLASLAVCLANYFFTQIDVVVAQRYLSGEDLGAYSAAGLFARGILWLPGPVLVVFFTARSGQDRSDKVTGSQLALFTALLVIGAGGVAGAKELLCRILWGHADPAVVQLMNRFALAMIPVGLLQALGFHFLAARRYPHCFAFGICGLFYAIALTWWGRSADQLLLLIFGGALGSLGVLGLVTVPGALRERAHARQS
jgi:O-antigen/teichoic acid export membrane protein